MVNNRKKLALAVPIIWILKVIYILAICVSIKVSLLPMSYAQLAYAGNTAECLFLNVC